MTGSDLANTAGSMSASDQASATWSPFVGGDTLALEVRLPSAAARQGFSLSVEQVSHIDQWQVPGAPGSDVGTRDLDQIGRAACGQTHVSCEDVTAAASATAKLLFVSGGDSYLCTGVLVADRNTSNTIPYMLTAAHCI